MRNDTSFPCMEAPTRCYIVSAPTVGQPTTDPLYALSCTRKGDLWASTKRGRWEEWCLILEDRDAGVYKLVNAAHQLVLVCKQQHNEDNGQYNSVMTILKAQNPTAAGFDEGSTSWFLERTTSSLGDDDEEDVMQLRSCNVNTYLACGTDNSNNNSTEKDGVVIHTTTQEELVTQSTALNFLTQNTSNTNWKLEFLTGELCYLQLSHHTSPPKLLLCDNLGFLKMSEVWGGWEIWRLTEAGRDRVRISSWTHHTRYLACTAHGKVHTTEVRDNDETLWKVEKAPKGLNGVLISSVPYGRLLRSDGIKITTTGYIDGVATTWQLTAGHRQRYTISHVEYNKRLSLIKDSQLKTSRHRRDCEVWELQNMDHGFVSLRHDKFKRCLQYAHGQGLTLSSKEEDTLLEHQQQQHWDQSGLWRMFPSPTGTGICFVSAVEPFLTLSCNAKGELETVEHQGPSQCWNLEPCMPRSLQAWQINLVIGGAVGGAVGAAILGPMLAVGMVGAEGAAVGTAVRVGAGMAAAEAGEIAAAATGMGLLGATALGMGTGVAVGLGATGLVVATSTRSRAEGTEMTRNHEEQNRPFCNWRSW